VHGKRQEQALEFLRERELARRWRVSVRTLQRWRSDRTGPVWLKICGRVLYPVEDVLRWEQASRRAAGQQTR
jgi:hypothetical protein